MLSAPGVIAASGSFGNPYLPVLPGQEDFTGQILHAAAYREPSLHAGQRVVVVGAGNSAIQIAHDLADLATVTLATRTPIRFIPSARWAAICISGSPSPVLTTCPPAAPAARPEGRCSTTAATGVP
nr:hypothetical protein GCM10020093_020690 [Planobispora longispora]